MPSRNRKAQKNESEKAPPSDEAAFVTAIKSICKAWSFILEETAFEGGQQLRVYFWMHSPMWMRIDIDPDKESAIFVGVVRAFEVPHERSDYNELISLIWAASLRANNTASVRIVDLPHPVIPRELVGRYVIFDRQPAASFIDLSRPDLPLIESIIVQSSLAAWNFSFLFRALKGCSNDERCDDYEEWATRVRQVTRWNPKPDLEIGNKRHHPNWAFFSRLDHGVSFFDLATDPSSFLCPATGGPNQVVFESPSGHLVSSETLRNYVDNKTIRKLHRWTSLHSPQVKDIDCAIEIEGLFLLPTESHLICLTQSGIIAINRDGGYDTFLTEQAHLKSRHQHESEFLYSSVQFQWSDRIPDDQFEELALELVKREHGVRRARRVGSSRAADGGRDLIADWLLPPSPWDNATEVNAFLQKRIIVQCKAYSKAINRSNVGDIVGTVDQFDASGLLLIAFPDVTPQLIDYLERVPQKRKIWADWWTRTEIEDRLRSNPDIVARFKDLVKVKDS